MVIVLLFFFFQAEDGIRDWSVTGVQTCALPISKLYDQRRRVRVLEEQLLRDLEFHGIVGKSPAMLEVFDFARKVARSEEHTSELQSLTNLVCRLLLEKKKKNNKEKQQTDISEYR